MKYKAAHKKGCFFSWLSVVAVVASVVWEKTRWWFVDEGVFLIQQILILLS